jgi:hypothetical protein
MTLTTRFFVFFAAVALIATGVSCDSHSWEDTKKLHGHGDSHGKADGAHGDDHASKDEAKKKDH